MGAVGQVDHFSTVSGVADRVPLRNAVEVALPCVIAARLLEEPRSVLAFLGSAGAAPSSRTFCASSHDATRGVTSFARSAGFAGVWRRVWREGKGAGTNETAASAA